MDGLPRELCLKIFHLLDHQSLASAPQGSTPPQNSELEAQVIAIALFLYFSERKSL